MQSREWPAPWPAITAQRLASLRRNVLDPLRECGDLLEAERQSHTLRRWRVPFDRYARAPLRLRPYRARSESAAAVWTDVQQRPLDTGRAERAFERANSRVRRVWRQSPVTALAIRSQLEGHRALHFDGYCVLSRIKICGNAKEPSKTATISSEDVCTGQISKTLDLHAFGRPLPINSLVS